MTQRDLIVLVADRDMENALSALFERPQSLGIRTISADILIHPQHDPACARRGVEFLSNFSGQYQHGLLMFDYEGCGREHISPWDLQGSVNQEFSMSTWGNRAKAIVLIPELEAWVWSDSPHVEDVIGWQGQQSKLRNWLIEQGWLLEGEPKPTRPKESFQAALRKAQTPRSSSLYRQLAERVSFRRCRDGSFLELRSTLSSWFS